VEISISIVDAKTDEIEKKYESQQVIHVSDSSFTREQLADDEPSRLRGANG
jgi:hypothetical protein